MARVFFASLSFFSILLAFKRAKWEKKKFRKYVKIIVNNDNMFQKFVYRFVIDWMKKARPGGVECWINSIQYINNIETVANTKISVTNVTCEKKICDDHMKHATKWKTGKIEKQKGKWIAFLQCYDVFENKLQTQQLHWMRSKREEMLFANNSAVTFNIRRSHI